MAHLQDMESHYGTNCCNIQIRITFTQKDTASACITYCTSSGNEIYAHLTVQYKNIARLSVRISCYTIPKSPKN